MASEILELTVDDVEAMVAAGELDEDAHVELLEGELVEVSPQGPEHAARHTELRDRLLAAYGTTAHVRNQCPLLAGRTSMPEPDVAVIRGRPLDYVARHPQGADAVLVIELAKTSQRLDHRKARIYAAGGVAVYWIVDLAARILEEHRDPSPVGYATRTVLRGAETVALPGLEQSWTIDAVLGRA